MKIFNYLSYVGFADNTFEGYNYVQDADIGPRKGKSLIKNITLAESCREISILL